MMCWWVFFFFLFSKEPFIWASVYLNIFATENRQNKNEVWSVKGKRIWPACCFSVLAIMDNTKLTALHHRRAFSNQQVTQMMKFRRISCKMIYIVCTASKITSGRHDPPPCLDGGDDGSLHFTGCTFTSEGICCDTSYRFRYCV